MEIDYTWNIEAWKELIQEFLDLITDFFSRLGVEIFKES